MKNNGLFTTLYIDDVRKDIKLNDNAKSRMATLAQAWKDHDGSSAASLWESFMKQAMGYLGFVSRKSSKSDSLYELFEDYGFSKYTGILYLIESDADIDDTDVGRFWPGKLIVELIKRNRNWGILSNGSIWRLYCTKSSRPFEDYVELSLADTLKSGDEPEYGLFEQFFHADYFVPEDEETDDEKTEQEEAAGVYKCKLDRKREASESFLETKVKNPLLSQIDEVLQYICNGFIFDTPRKGEEYTEDERNDIFESAVKLLYRCLFLFYADSRRLLPSEPEKIEVYKNHSISAICVESHKFQWGKRKDNEGYDLWQHLKGLINSINEGDPEYGIMGYNGGLFDDEKEVFLGGHKLRNDFMARALYLLSYVEPYNHDPDKEYIIPYEDLEVRHLGELYENILEYKVILADSDRIRRRNKKGIEILLSSETSQHKGDVLIKKGDVFFGETAFERKQTGSYYTPESLVRFLNSKAAIDPLKERFGKEFRNRFDEFIQQAIAGQDSSARQGGARAAIALIERFVREVILDFKVCDPAMGSGHFLVDLTNQMAGLVVELLNDIPDISGVKTQITSKPNTWRRLITRHCIFGVDINSLAVDLAKLSLWLNCFASNHKLTFLDQHLRCGNSLIGIRTFDQLKSVPERNKDPKKKKDANLDLFPDFDDFSKSLTEAASIYKSIMDMDEDDTDRQKDTFEEACALAEEKFEPIADLYTSYLMDSSITEDQYRSLFKHFIQGKDDRQINNLDLNEVWSKVKKYRSNHQFFHWALNFPSIFGPNGNCGFNAAVGNPPWDKIKPNSQEFFSTYDLCFRKFKKQEANRISKTLMKNNLKIKSKWKEYCGTFHEQNFYFKEQQNYRALGQGDINTYKLFLEKFYIIIQECGYISIIVPSGLYTDKGCKLLRKLFFNKSRIELLYCFENRWPAVFNSVDGRFKFVLFCTQKHNATDMFKSAFMEHGPERLPVIDSSALKISVNDIKKFSPINFNIMEFKNQNEIDIASYLFKNSHFFGDYLKNKWDTAFQREFHMTDDSPLFISSIDEVDNNNFIPFLEGKQFWILTNAYGKQNYWMSHIDAQIKPTTQTNRVVYRAVSASTNERTFIPTVIPASIPTGNTVNVCPLPKSKVIIVAAITSSFVWDWIIRIKVTTSLNKYIIDQMPIIDFDGTDNKINNITSSILVRGARLVCTSKFYSTIWKDSYVEKWNLPDFWYPNKANIRYGPIHEQELRIRIQDESSQLTPKWVINCGVYDQLPDQRDTGDRAQLRAEIDAYVAHLYTLSRNDFSYILDTFPVLKRKEEAAFGEYMSKRKCLEEYDRIATIL